MVRRKPPLPLHNPNGLVTKRMTDALRDFDDAATQQRREPSTHVRRLSAASGSVSRVRLQPTPPWRTPRSKPNHTWTHRQNEPAMEDTREEMSIVDVPDSTSPTVPAHPSESEHESPDWGSVSEKRGDVHLQMSKNKRKLKTVGARPQSHA